MNKEGNELIDNVEKEIKGKMPPECYEKLKRFTLCKFSHDQEVIKEKGYEHFLQNYGAPFQRVAGCKTEFDNYNNCYQDFYNRYIDLKNYVADLEGMPRPFNKKELRQRNAENFTKNNFGLNKF